MRLGLIFKIGLISYLLLGGQVLTSCENTNSLCSTAEILTAASLTDEYCFVACNDKGSNAHFNPSSQGCESSPFQTVWYSFVSPSTQSLLSITLSSATLKFPQVSIYNGNCDKLSLAACNQGYNKQVSIENLVLDLASPYMIAVSTFDGAVGEFELCISMEEDPSVCNKNSKLEVVATSEDSPKWGPYKPGEEVEVCYTIEGYQNVSCNYLQAIIPLLGNGWDPSSVDSEGRPHKITKSLITQGHTNFTTSNPVCEGDAAGEWRWHNSGTVQYNLNSENPLGLRNRDDIPSGWIFVNAFDPSCFNFNDGCCTNPNEDPNNGYGDDDYPVCGTGPSQSWTICFALTAALSPSVENYDCSIGMKSLADGEIGALIDNACNADIISYTNASVEVCSAPAISISQNLIEVCAGEEFSVDLSSDKDFTNYYWHEEGKDEISIVDENKTLRHTLNDPGKYFIIVYGTNACKSEPALLEVIVVAELGLQLIQEPAIACPGEKVTLRAIVNGVNDLSSLSYSWNFDDSEEQASIATDIDYNYELTVSLGSCSVKELIEINHYEASTAILSSSESVCLGDKAEMKLQLEGQGPWSLLIKDDTGLERLIETSNTEYSEEILLEKDRSYDILSATDGRGCAMNVTGEWDVEVYTELVLTAGEDLYIGCDVIEVQLQGELITSASNVEILWTGVDESLIIDGHSMSPIVTAAGIYTVSVTDMVTGCILTDVVEVKELSTELNLEISNSDEVVLEYGETFFLEAQVDIAEENIASVLWSHDGSIECETCMSSMAYPLEDVIYQLEIKDLNGCSESQEIKVSIRAKQELNSRIYVPNTFDPSSKDENNTYKIYGDFARIDDFIISDRWGNEVFVIQDMDPNEQSIDWDGRVDGVSLSPGVYAYILRLTLLDGSFEQRVGTITLIN